MLRHDLRTLDDKLIPLGTMVVNLGQPDGANVRRGGACTIIVTAASFEHMSPWSSGMEVAVSSDALLIAGDEVAGACGCPKENRQCYNWQVVLGRREPIE